MPSDKLQPPCYRLELSQRRARLRRCRNLLQLTFEIRDRHIVTVEQGLPYLTLQWPQVVVTSSTPHDHEWRQTCQFKKLEYAHGLMS